MYYKLKGEKHMRIAVYDEVQEDAGIMKAQIRKALKALNIEGKIIIETYASTFAMLDYINIHKIRYDLYVIALNDAYEKGLELSIKISGEQGDAKIAFSANRESYLKCLEDIISIRPYSLIPKPVKYDKVLKMIKNVIDKVCENEDSIVLKNKDGIYTVINSEITYIESDNRYLIVNREEKEPIRVISTFEKLEKQLNDDFVRCHRSYYVNCRKIRRLNKKIVQLANDKTIPVSGTNYKNVYNRFVEIFGKDRLDEENSDVMN